MQIKIAILDGGCSVKNVEMELTPTMKQDPSQLENGKIINLRKEDGFSQMELTTKAASKITNQTAQEYGTSKTETQLEDVTNKQLFPMKIQMTRK